MKAVQDFDKQIASDRKAFVFAKDQEVCSMIVKTSRSERESRSCKGSVILVNDQRSATLSDKPNARKRKGSQHPDLR
jgi:hypothetical protein